MKTWKETRDVLREIQCARRAGHGCALAILTQVKGSSFRRPGAKLLIRADGALTGNVSGGCLEQDLRERALTAIAGSRQAVVHYNTGSDEDTVWGLGLGCDGELDLLLVPVLDDGWVDRVLARMENHRPFALRWRLHQEHPTPPEILEEEAPPRPSTDPETFTETLTPPPDLVVIGAGDDALPLVELAALAGFRVTVSDHRPAYLAPERFPRAHAIRRLRPEDAPGVLPQTPGTMVVIKNHALHMDMAWAAYYAEAPIAYLGLLGPRKRCEKITATLPQPVAPVFGPCGLDVGSEGAEQIALAVVTELLAVVNRRAPIHLRDRTGPIHT
ncbi:MAG TPA: XdhC family protein [Kiritimatiellia bacterium]|nr:XdhC family protein [Kiritimatiellia bacterium]HMO98210.1 XdhC family protein [Kiritimatiellia bacterium]HMP96472.1 XdhC family protein [Kiritimatiellia bacterium]